VSLLESLQVFYGDHKAFADGVVGVALILELGMALWWRRAPRRAVWFIVAAGFTLATSMSWQVYASRTFPLEFAKESTYATAHLTQALEGHLGGSLFQVARLSWDFGELAPLVLLWFLVRKTSGREGRSLLVWVALPYLFFSLIPTKMPNYTMLAAPAVCLMIAVAVTELASHGGKRRRLFAGVLILLPLRTALVAWKPFRAIAEEREIARHLRGFQATPGPLAIFDASYPIEIMFYSNHLAYDEHLSPGARSLGSRAGYRVESKPVGF